MSEETELDGMAAYYAAIRNPDRNDPSWPLPSFDARDWAEAFCKRYPMIDDGVALGWFANALMRGYDQASVLAPEQQQAEATE